MTLFTDSEKEIMRNEFTYNDTRRLNRNNEGDDLFTEHNLESTQNALLKNVSTKSVILAPFNSTVSHVSSEEPQSRPLAKKNEALHSSTDMFRKGEVLKFNARVREADRQYEQNNNCELDNGVYNKFYEESEKEEEKGGGKEEKKSEDSLENSFKASTIRSEDDVEEDLHAANVPQKKKSPKPQTELEKLEVLIEKKKVEEGGGNDSGPAKETNREKGASALAAPIALVIEEGIVGAVVTYGYPRSYVVRCLNNDEANYCTTAYYLLAS